MTIINAHIEHLDLIAPIFDAYRVFYRQKSDIEAAKIFLYERFKNKESIIYLAMSDDKAVGFTQLYPLFSSVSMQRMYILNDLYVAPEHRNQGIAEKLINKAKELCVSLNHKGLGLQTAQDNPAQKLYERLDFKRDTDLQYFWTNSNLK
jgi:GNAT superfamily N-acetyltransferase